ncbi:hypothetical protein BDZ91DRAFT_801170 [Kalaharituber pfeilii]|nr:hypothetical protein BDZ91DRAFT_801170 [Kalaharituber pfeilii]
MLPGNHLVTEQERGSYAQWGSTISQAPFNPDFTTAQQIGQWDGKYSQQCHFNMGSSQSAWFDAGTDIYSRSSSCQEPDSRIKTNFTSSSDSNSCDLDTCTSPGGRDKVNFPVENTERGQNVPKPHKMSQSCTASADSRSAGGQQLHITFTAINGTSQPSYESRKSSGACKNSKRTGPETRQRSAINSSNREPSPKLSGAAPTPAKGGQIKCPFSNCRRNQRPGNEKQYFRRYDNLGDHLRRVHKLEMGRYARVQRWIQENPEQIREQDK